MTLYLLTEVVDHESEKPLLITDDLEAAKAAAVLPEPTTGGRWPGVDGYNIYAAEPGAKPEPLLYDVVRCNHDPATRTYSYALTGWTNE